MDKVIEIIATAKATLTGFSCASEKTKEHIALIESFIKRDLPDEIRSFLANSSPKPNSEMSSIFMGYEPIWVESLSKMYEKPNGKNGCLFLGTFLDLNEDLVLGEDEGLEVIQDLNHELEDGPTIHDIKDVVPLMDGEGYYMVLVYKPDGKTEIAIATEDYCLSSVAPSLSEYLDNLSAGVEQGVFKLDAEGDGEITDIEAPDIWRERVEAVKST